MKKSITTVVLVFVAQLLLQPDALAVEFDAEARVGIGISDNLGQSAQNELDDTIATAGFSFSVIQQSRSLDLTVSSQFDYLDYADGSFDAEWIGGLNGEATLTMVDERVRWIFRENFGQQLSDPLQSSRPGNREDVNIFTTGPTLSFFAGSRNPVRLDLRYARRNFEIQPNDNNQLSSTISIGRNVSRQSTISLNGTATRVEFDESTLSPPIERYETFVTLERNGNQNTFSIDIGFNEAEFAGVDADGLLVRVDWSRTTSANGVLTVSGGSQFSDQGDVFGSLQNLSTDFRETNDVLNSSAAFLNNSFEVGYSLQTTRHTANVSWRWRQEDYKGGLALDRDIYGGSLGFRREISRTVFAGAQIRFERRDFKFQDRRDDDLTLALDVGYRITPSLNVSLHYQHFQRNSVTQNADFTENRAFVRLAYTPAWSR